jgi:hypothetical protein
VGDELTVFGDNQRITLIAHANVIDHPPHFFQADLTHERPCGLTNVAELDADNGCRQEIVVDAYWR